MEEEARAELERLLARIQANNDEAEAIHADFTAIIDRLMAGGPEERQMAQQALAGWEEGFAADIAADTQHVREAMHNRIGDGLI